MLIHTHSPSPSPLLLPNPKHIHTERDTLSVVHAYPHTFSLPLSSPPSLTQNTSTHDRERDTECSYSFRRPLTSLPHSTCMYVYTCISTHILPLPLPSSSLTQNTSTHRERHTERCTCLSTHILPLPLPSSSLTQNTSTQRDTLSVVHAYPHTFSLSLSPPPP